jgi:hypothetical protein
VSVVSVVLVSGGRSVANYRDRGRFFRCLEMVFAKLVVNV